MITSDERKWSQKQADFMIALISIAWGSSYVMMKVGLGGIPPFSLTALRFGIAFLCICAIFFKELSKTTLRVMKKARFWVLSCFGFAVPWGCGSWACNNLQCLWLCCSAGGASLNRQLPQAVRKRQKIKQKITQKPHSESFLFSFEVQLPIFCRIIICS